MIIEMTLMADDGTPFIMDESDITLYMKPIDEEEVLMTFNGKVVGNKVNFYIETEKDKHV